MPTARSALTASARLVLLGLPGILSLLLVLPPVPGIPRVVLLVNPLVLLVAAAVVGSLVAPRCGFRSILAGIGAADKPIAGRALAEAGLGGIAIGIALALVDQATAPFWQTGLSVPALADGWTPANLLNGFAYGGVVEEIVMRWGLMSIFVWLAWRILGRGDSRPGSSHILIGVVLAAILFSLGHLPVLFLQHEPAFATVVRTLGLNLAGGLVFGLVFARVNLEASMLCHAGFHVGVAILAVARG